MEENKNITPEQLAENILKIEQSEILSLNEVTAALEKNILHEPQIAASEQPQTANDQPQPEHEMEVHHHTHATHGKKNWKSYFWEFSMLFLAVFCGFLAEYTLEHKIEADREKQYMHSLSEDLRRDTAELSQAFEFGQNQIILIDSLIELIYHQSLSVENIRRLYMFNYSTGRSVGLTFEDRTTVQLRNAGGMRLLRKRNAVDSILGYWNRLETMEFIRERLQQSGSDIADLGVRIFHTKFIIPGDRPLAPPNAIREDATLIDDDPKLMAQYVNRQYIKRQRLNNYLHNMQLVKENAKRLLETIKKEYHLN